MFVTVPGVSKVRVKGVGLMETDKVPLATAVVTVLPTAIGFLVVVTGTKVVTVATVVLVGPVKTVRLETSNSFLVMKRVDVEVDVVVVFPIKIVAVAVVRDTSIDVVVRVTGKRMVRTRVEVKLIVSSVLVRRVLVEVNTVKKP